MPEQVQHTLYQVSTATALVEGIYQGAVQVAILAVTLAFLILVQGAGAVSSEHLVTSRDSSRNG
jgi:hypothetical protein